MSTTPPIVEFIGTDVDASRALAELRQLYRVLKDDQGKLYCVFMTGITRFARSHLFSAANKHDGHFRHVCLRCSLRLYGT